IGGVGIYAATRGGSATDGTSLPGGKIATVKTIDRAGKDAGGLEIKDGNAWRPVRANDTLDGGAELRTDKRTRAAVELADGTRYVLDHETQLSMDSEDGRHAKLIAGRI